MIEPGPALEPGEDPAAYLHRCGIRFFSWREVTRGAAPVPRVMVPRIVLPLRLADELRDALGHPLIVGWGYRDPNTNAARGGAPGSQHVQFRALDLDLPSTVKGPDAEARFYGEAVRLWCAHGRAARMGLGLYGGPTSGRRVHIDAGWRCRGGGGATWALPWPQDLARSLGLEPPDAAT